MRGEVGRAGAWGEPFLVNLHTAFLQSGAHHVHFRSDVSVAVQCPGTVIPLGALPDLEPSELRRDDDDHLPGVAHSMEYVTVTVFWKGNIGNE